MPASEPQPSFIRRMSTRRTSSMDVSHDHHGGESMDIFPKNVSDRFNHLIPQQSTIDDDSILSIPWIINLLHTYISCDQEFKETLTLLPSHPSSQVDRLFHDLLDRYVKTLDICNAATHGVEEIRSRITFAHIAVTALRRRPFREAGVRRAKKALLSVVVNDINNNNNKNGLFLRSPSWCASKTWSAAKHVSAMSSGLAAPRAGELAAAGGVAQPVYVMSVVMVFVMWALVMAIPCQERAGGVTAQVPVPRLPQPMAKLQERVADVWRKRERRAAVGGLMAEMRMMERISEGLVEKVEGATVFPLEEKVAEEVAAMVEELRETCMSMEEELVELQRQIREVFRKTMRSREEVLVVVALQQQQSNKSGSR